DYQRLCKLLADWRPKVAASPQTVTGADWQTQFRSTIGSLFLSFDAALGALMDAINVNFDVVRRFRADLHAASVVSEEELTGPLDRRVSVLHRQHERQLATYFAIRSKLTISEWIPQPL
ncbi:MAG: hypothetical protein QOE30_4021, partial [Mycobacterium sp.]|uniref:hypothetical protein n=1 Tax=Mycobacterium sp. TaxID=1785 RepID=UPI0028B3D1AD